MHLFLFQRIIKYVIFYTTPSIILSYIDGTLCNLYIDVYSTYLCSITIVRKNCIVFRLSDSIPPRKVGSVACALKVWSGAVGYKMIMTAASHITTCFVVRHISSGDSNIYAIAFPLNYEAIGLNR